MGNRGPPKRAPSEAAGDATQCRHGCATVCSQAATLQISLIASMCSFVSSNLYRCTKISRHWQRSDGSALRPPGWVPVDSAARARQKAKGKRQKAKGKRQKARRGDGGMLECANTRGRGGCTAAAGRVCALGSAGEPIWYGMEVHSECTPKAVIGTNQSHCSPNVSGTTRGENATTLPHGAAASKVQQQEPSLPERGQRA